MDWLIKWSPNQTISTHQMVIVSWACWNNSKISQVEFFSCLVNISKFSILETLDMNMEAADKNSAQAGLGMMQS